MQSIKSSILLLFAFLAIVTGCKEKTPQFGTPNVEIASIQNHFLKWYKYNKIYIDLSKDYHALNSNSEEINKQAFLEELSTGKYFIVRMNSTKELTFYKLVEIPEDGIKTIGDHIAKQAERELRNLSFVNTSLPDLDFKTLKGKSYDINHLKDQYLVLNFWYTTCGKCKTELPDIEALAQKYKYRDIKFLNVSINEEHTLSNFLEDKDYQVAMLRLNKKFVLDSLNIRLFPSYFIIDPNQRVIKVSNNSKQLEKRLKEILAQLK